MEIYLSPLLFFVLGFYFALNLLVLFLFMSDKHKAKKNQRRIPEKTLLLVGFLGGGIGGLLAQKIFRHKTQKGYFTFIYVLALVLHVAAWVAVWVFV
jgi:uncharacterized membrane protein YsdA (DUF1294 family)